VLISVAICTWNRATLLRRTLSEFERLRTPAGVEWELSVVNNHCTDDTDAVLASFARRLPVRVLHEPEPGLSFARNCAVRAASGNYIVWTDDDVLVDAEWLAAYAEAFARWPEAAVFGGRIDPWWETPPPAWLARVWPNVAAAYGARDFGDEPIPLSPTRLPFGANYAVRMAEQAAHPYDTALGLRPDSDMPGEETSLVRALLDEGARGWWLPGARVRHYVRPEEMTERYLRRYAFAYGRYRARMHAEAEDGAVRLFGRPRWRWRDAMAKEARYRVRRLRRGSPEAWIGDLLASAEAWGYLREYGT
jgi:glycosyltransferase involved in cell wall biosynthesis